MSARTPQIFVFVNGDSPFGLQGNGIAEDGAIIAGHSSSTIGWLKHDMGIEGDWQHDKYRAHYPDGYEVVDLTDLSFDETAAHPGFAAAVALFNKNTAASSIPDAKTEGR